MPMPHPHRMDARRAHLVLALWALLILGGLTFAPPASRAQDYIPLPDAPDAGANALNPDPASLAALRAEAADSGEVRVIVGLREAGSLSRGGLADRDRAARLRSARARLLDSLAAEGHQPRQERQFRFLPYAVLTVDAAALDALARSPLVDALIPDGLSAPALNTSVTQVGAAGPGGAWSMGYNGAGWTVAVLDTGVDKNHPALAGQVVSEACYNAISSVASSRCPGGATASTASGSGADCAASFASGCEHGTHVAGIVASKDGVFPGVAPGATLIAINVFSRFTPSFCGGSYCLRTYDSDQIAGMERVYALRNTYNIAAVNMSLGSSNKYTSEAACDGANPARKAAIDLLRGAGIATVISSGNSGFPDGLSAPGCISSAVSVGAVDDSDAVWAFSNAAGFLDLFAPGVSITSARPFANNFQTYSGTSMAAPHVAGAWAILRGARPDASVDAVLNALASTGLGVTDGRAGAGGRVKPRLRVNAALNALAPAQPQPPDAPGELLALPDGFGRIDLAWDNVADEDGYRVQWSYKGTGGWKLIELAGPNVTDSALTGLSCATTRYFRVIAFNAAGNAAPSPVVGATTAACPDAPEVELLVNGNFEINDDKFATVPDGWKKSGPFIKDRVRTDAKQKFSFSPRRAFQMTGTPDEASSISQSIDPAPLGLAVGDTLLLRAQIDQRTGVPKSRVIRATLTYSDGAQAHLRLILAAEAAPGYAPQARSLTLARADLTAITVVVEYSQPSGQFLVDDLRFGIIRGAGAIRAVAAADAPASMPASAPDLRGQ